VADLNLIILNIKSDEKLTPKRLLDTLCHEIGHWMWMLTDMREWESKRKTGDPYKLLLEVEKAADKYRVDLLKEYFNLKPLKSIYDDITPEELKQIMEDKNDC
jgi:hypothetical protein